MSKGGGAWKVAYADFVTAMMAFFMVMWITAQNKAMKAAVVHYFNDPFNSESKSKGPEAAGSTTTGPKAPGSMCLLPSRAPGDPPGVVPTKTAPKSSGHRVVDPGTKPAAGGGAKSGSGRPSMFMLHDGKRQSMGTVISFVGDSGELSERGKDQLKVLVPSLLGKRQKIEIRGHARQHAPTPGLLTPDTWQISYARCIATMKYLEQAGVEPDRIRLSQAAAYEPRTVRDGAETRIQNSCVDVYVLNEMAEDSVGATDAPEQVTKSP